MKTSTILWLLAALAVLWYYLANRKTTPAKITVPIYNGGGGGTPIGITFGGGGGADPVGINWDDDDTSD